MISAARSWLIQSFQVYPHPINLVIWWLYTIFYYKQIARMFLFSLSVLHYHWHHGLQWMDELYWDTSILYTIWNILQIKDEDIKELVDDFMIHGVLMNLHIIFTYFEHKKNFDRTLWGLWGNRVRLCFSNDGENLITVNIKFSE